MERIQQDESASSLRQVVTFPVTSWALIQVACVFHAPCVTELVALLSATRRFPGLGVDLAPSSIIPIHILDLFPACWVWLDYSNKCKNG
jgi:hypothetical protein